MTKKFYVVWSGRRTGVFNDWASAQRVVDKYAGARFKSFPTRAEAEQAFARGADSGTAVNKAATKRGSAPDSEREAAHSSRQFYVLIYCDGACDPNPGNAGSGIVLYRDGRLAQLWYGLYNPIGTNNTAELNALYHALRMAKTEIKKGHTVQVCSDSAYAINCVRTWAPTWERKGWTKPGGEIKNLEIIQDCYAIYRRIESELALTHVAAHIGTEGNELADRMAMLAVQTKQEKLRRYRGKMDIPTLLKMRAG